MSTNPLTAYPKHSLDVVARTDNPFAEPTVGVQYAVLDDGKYRVFGDQSWVAHGACIEDGSFPDGKIFHRSVTVTYGEWRSVDDRAGSETLWAVQVAGTGDLIPAANRRVADETAAEINGLGQMIRTRPTASEFDVQFSAEVVEWPYDAEQHAEALAELEAEGGYRP